MTSKKQANKAILIALTLILATIAHAQDILPGIDNWETPCGIGPVDFTENPIPEDFFGPLTGIELQGLPIGPGTTDTIVRRKTDLPDGESGMVDVEIVALSLVSCQPIVVDGQVWDLHVTLDPEQPSLGTMTIDRHDDPNQTGERNIDGSLEALILVNLQGILTSRDGGEPLTVKGSQTLSAHKVPWSHSPPPDYPGGLGHGGFYPGPMVFEDGKGAIYPALARGEVVPDANLPPLWDPNVPDSGFHLSDDSRVRWESEEQQLVIDLNQPSTHCPVTLLDRSWTVDPLTQRPVEVHNFESTFNGHVTVTHRLTEQVLAESVPIQLTGPAQTVVFDKDPNQTFGRFETELTWMQLQGSIETPTGMLPIVIGVHREDPQRRSLGETEVFSVSNIGSSGLDGVKIRSFFDVYTELSVFDPLTNQLAGPFPSQGPPAHMVFGLPPAPGDTDGDGDVDAQDLQNVLRNMTDPVNDDPDQDTIVDLRPQDGDVDGDRDVDLNDLAIVLANFSDPGGAPQTGGARLLYNPDNGNVRLVPPPGGSIIGFILENAPGAPDFNLEGNPTSLSPGGTRPLTFPVGGYSIGTPQRIGWVDPAGGIDQVHDLGDGFPTGLDNAELDDFTTSAHYIGSQNNSIYFDEFESFRTLAPPDPSGP